MDGCQQKCLGRGEEENGQVSSSVPKMEFFHGFVVSFHDIDGVVIRCRVEWEEEKRWNAHDWEKKKLNDLKER